MKITSEKFRIGDVAKKLNVERFVIRFWEREFGIKAHRSTGGQRFYNEKDMQRIMLIKELLYDNGFTIAGAKKHLQEQKAAPSKHKASKKIRITGATLDTTPKTLPEESPATPSGAVAHDLTQKLTGIREQLIALRDMLLAQKAS